ncbi:MAG TPA: hypothetical protein VK705_09570 [Ferruginibacter sp.]|jgi:hypothetical protein|nr:hypothetical protein [Ferruginibacter sp.]
MKQLLFVVFLFIALTSQAQTNTAPPTNDDAISFINKVLLNNYWLLKDNSYPVKTVVVSLQDCHLIIKEAKPFTGSPDFSTTTTIDLTQCRVVKTRYDKSADIPAADSMSVMNSLGDNAITLTKSYNHKSSAPEDLPVFKFVLLNNYAVKSSNYQARLERALEFLVNSCGGNSSTNKDSNDKF